MDTGILRGHPTTHPGDPRRVFSKDLKSRPQAGGTLPHLPALRVGSHLQTEVGLTLDYKGGSLGRAGGWVPGGPGHTGVASRPPGEGSGWAQGPQRDTGVSDHG